MWRRPCINWRYKKSQQSKRNRPREAEHDMHIVCGFLVLGAERRTCVSTRDDPLVETSKHRNDDALDIRTGIKNSLALLTTIETTKSSRLDIIEGVPRR
jgi:hypothetical protein